jgi:hypothetical protein
MDRIFAWIVDRLRWLFLAAAVGGVALAYIGWSDSSHIREVAANGVEATARIEGATRTTRRRGGESYSLKLSWRDAKGNARSAEGVSVSNTFARRITSGNSIIADTVRIKYLANDADSAPILLDDAASQEETDQFMLTLGIGLFGGGAIGSLVMLLLPRRRRSEAAVPRA